MDDFGSFQKTGSRGTRLNSSNILLGATEMGQAFLNKWHNLHRTPVISQNWQRSLCLIALVGLGSAAMAADEVIEIDGDSGWCTGVGTEVIYTPEGELNDCGCADGFDELDPPDENGEPLCGYDFGEDEVNPGSDSVDASDGTGPGDIDPTKPTLSQCEQLNDQCIQAAGNLTQQCRDNRTRFNQIELANGNPCHGQSLEDLLDGFRYRNLWLTYACTPSDFRDINNTYTDNCRVQAIRRGMDRCNWGVDAQSQTQSASSSKTMNFKSPIFEAGIGSTRESTLTVSTPYGIGDNQVCMALGTKAVDQCTADLIACRVDASDGTQTSELVVSPKKTYTASNNSAKASGTNTNAVVADLDGQAAEVSPADTLAPMSLDDHLRAQVDRARLGLLDDDAAVGTRIFRAVPRQRLEIPVLYTERLRFLANWSGFLRRNGVSAAAIRGMHDVLRREQFRLQAELFTESSIVQAVFAVDMRTGTIGTDALRDLLEMYRSRGGLRRQMVFGHFRVVDASKDIFGDALGNEFLDTVWPGMIHFGFAAPFEARQTTSPVEGGELAPTGPIGAVGQ